MNSLTAKKLVVFALLVLTLGFLVGCSSDSNSIIDTTQYTLSVSTTGEGTVEKSPNKNYYSLNEKVTLTANAADGWVFSNWEGSYTGANNPATVTMDGDLDIIAVFTQSATGEGWIGEPELSKTTIAENQEYEINLTLLVNKAKDELLDTDSTTAIESPVELYREDGSDWVAVNYLKDDGILLYGDEIKNDRIYSTILLLNEANTGTINYKVVVTTADEQEYEVFFEVTVIEIDEEKVEAINTLNDFSTQKPKKFLLIRIKALKI